MASDISTKLTIAIPSYNRNEVLKKNLQVLLNQINDEVEILIIDNYSIIPIEITLEEEIRNNLGLKVIRNRENIGLSANLIRCMEHCKTNWMWLLSDDDLPVFNSISIVQETISANENVDYINFNSNYSKNRNSSFEAVGSNECLEKVESIHSLFLISLGVYNVTKLLPYLRFAYLYSYTLVPHFVLLMMSLGNSGKVLFSADKILKDQGDVEDPNNTWSFLTLTLGLPTILELPVGFSSANTKKISNFIYSQVISRPILSLERVLQLYNKEKLDVLRYCFVQPYKRMRLGMPFLWEIEYQFCKIILSNGLFINFYLYLMRQIRKRLKKNIESSLNDRYNRV